MVWGMKAGRWFGCCGMVAAAWVVGACGEKGEQAREDAGAAGYEVTAAGFHKAAAGDEVEVLKSLAKGGMDIAIKDEAGNTALHAAAAAGAEKSVTWLLDRGLEVDTAGAGGRTALAVAAEAGQASMTRHLLRQGADPSRRDAEGYKPLQRAVSGGHAAVVEELAPRERGDLDAALLMASLLGKAEVIDVLTNYGASVYARMEDGRTALMVAAENGHQEAVKTLLEAGANRFALDEQGRTAVDFARANGHEPLVSLFDGASPPAEIGIEEPGVLAEGMLAFLDESQAAGPVAGGEASGAGSVDPAGEVAVKSRAGGVAMIEGAVVSVATAGGKVMGGNRRDAARGGGGGGEGSTGGPASGGGEPGSVPGTVAGEGTASSRPVADAATPALVMRHYRETELPVRVKSVVAEKVRMEVLAGPRREVEVAAGELIPGSRLRVTRVEARVQGSKLNDGRPEDVSRVEVEDTLTGVRREWVAGTPSMAHEPLAVVEDEGTGRRYVAKEGARFRTQDGVEYLVGDVRANQLVLEKAGTGETVTLPMRGPRG